MVMPELTVFAGPSAHGLSPSAWRGLDVQWMPPVRRGDMDRLLAARSAPGVIVICDGVFQSAPAVSHAEICRALDAGWPVWGVSSMGAIRAHELRHEGMRGHGHVHAQFTRFDDFTDDELCLLHFPEPPYFPITEALVNLRYAFECQGQAMGLSLAQQATVLDRLSALWFGERSLARIREVMVGEAGTAPPVADAVLNWLGTHRIKTMDLDDLLRKRPWRDPLSAAPARRRPHRR